MCTSLYVCLCVSVFACLSACACWFFAYKDKFSDFLIMYILNISTRIIDELILDDYFDLVPSQPQRIISG